VAVHDLDPKMTPPEKPDTWAPENMPRVADLLTRSYFNNLLQPMRIAETIGRSLPGMAKLAVQAGKGDVSLKNTRPAPKTRFNGKVSAHRVWDAVPFKLAEVRAIKEAVPDATVNDVILTVVGGALRSYLQGKNDLPKETMTAMAPISVRQEGEKAALGNLVSAMVVGLGTQIEDPLERLRFVHDEAVNSKAMTNAVGAKTLSDYSKLIPSGLAGLGARLYTRVGAANMHAPAFNVVVTNVPGPKVPLYFCGAQMVFSAGTAPVFDSMGLIHPVYSYVDTIAVSFTADRDMLPDPDVYAAALRSSFEALKAAALKPAAVAARSAAANNVFMGILPWVIKVDVAICSSPAGAGGKTEAVAGLGRRGTLVSRLLTQDEPIVAPRVSFKQGALHQGQSRPAVQFAFMRAAECSTSAQRNIAKHNIGGCSWIAVVFSSSPLVWPLPVQRPSLRRRPHRLRRKPSPTSRSSPIRFRRTPSPMTTI
ncbi:MAG: DUF1298 domain-containing protein, partial [Afipia sp.]|nr:DUF1298 domain-containing protein [Afipia sp.]